MNEEIKKAVGAKVRILKGQFAGEEGWITEVLRTGAGRLGYNVKLTTGPMRDKRGTALIWSDELEDLV